MTTKFKQYSTMKHIMIVLIAALALASCGGGEDKNAKLEALKTQQSELAAEIKTLEAEIAATDTTTKSVKVKDVLVTEMQPVIFRHYIDVQGAVDAEENVNVQPTIPGKVQRVYVNEGSSVKAGQVLAEIDHDVLTKSLNAMQPQIAMATETFDRQKRLWDQKIGSEMQFLQAKTQKETTEQQAAAMQEQIEMCKIKSPINGTVDMVSIKVGQIASAESQQPAFRIVNLGNLKVKGEIAEAYASKVKTGNKVILHFPDLNTNVESKITFAERVIDPLTRSFTTEASLSGDNAQYHPNMVAILKIVDYENPSAISLPINVIQSSSNEQFVFVATLEGNKAVARKRVVTVGNTYNGQAEILTGLAANDKVVTSGQLDLVDGMQIKF